MRVRIEPAGREFDVAHGRNLLDAALDAGLNLPHSCKGGSCGSCRAVLRAGRIEYPRGLPLGIDADDAAQGGVLLCQAHALTDVVIETREIASVTDVEILELPCRVERLQPLAADVMGVWLRLPAVQPMTWQAGQYVDVLLPGGRRRSFSIANPPHDASLIELHVRRVAGGEFTESVFGAMKPGALLRIEGPLGQFVYREGTRPMLLIGGGTGYAPLKAILRHVLETGVGRFVTLAWGARSPEDLYEHASLQALAARMPAFRYWPVVSESSGAPGIESGLVHRVVIDRLGDLSSYDIYAAGPPAMIAAIRRDCVAAGADAARLYFDSFEYAPDTLARQAAVSVPASPADAT